MKEAGDLRKLKREQLVEILCEQRDIIDEQQEKIQEMAKQLDRIDRTLRQDGFTNGGDEVVKRLDSLEQLMRASMLMQGEAPVRSSDGDMVQQAQEIISAANRRANEIIDRANDEANDIVTMANMQARDIVAAAKGG